MSAAAERQRLPAFRRHARILARGDGAAATRTSAGASPIPRRSRAASGGCDARPSAVHVKKVKDDVVIVAYPVRERLEVDVQTTTLDAYDASAWIRKGDAWRCVLHTEALAGDPFGRDRKPQ